MNASFSFSNSYSFNKPNINFDAWVESMRKSVVEHDDEEITKIPVSIFTVPKVLLDTDPNSYIPQQVAFYLPVVDLDVNTEVYLRNLVAYEACVATGPLVVARYTELMNGIIDTEEDAKHFVNPLKSDKEVADLWNGMSKSVKLTKIEKMDKVIEDVNKRYAKTWSVKAAKFMRTYVFASWKLLCLLAAMFLLFLTTVQAVCSVYSCARVLHQLPKIPGTEGTAGAQ